MSSDRAHRAVERDGAEQGVSAPGDGSRAAQLARVRTGLVKVASGGPRPRADARKRDRVAAQARAARRPSGTYAAVAADVIARCRR
jgi:hypothetical protein